MSKIGRKPIVIPAEVTVTLTESDVHVSGKGGALRLPLLSFIQAEITGSDGGQELKFIARSDERQARANWGTMAALAKNAIIGVSRGFSKTLEIQGIGFKAALEGERLILSVGFTHPVKVTPPPGIAIAINKNQIVVSGINKELVGQTAAAIRTIKKPEPYKGKGIRYQGEIVRRKAGKKAAGAGAASSG